MHTSSYFRGMRCGNRLVSLVHRLNVSEDVKLVKKKKRNFSTEKNAAIKEEVDDLLEVDLIEPCDYLERLAKMLMVKKANQLLLMW